MGEGIGEKGDWKAEVEGRERDHMLSFFFLIPFSFSLNRELLMESAMMTTPAAPTPKIFSWTTARSSMFRPNLWSFLEHGFSIIPLIQFG